MKAFSRISKAALLTMALGCIHCDSPKKTTTDLPVSARSDSGADVDAADEAPLTTRGATDAGKMLQVLDAQIAGQKKRIEARQDNWLAMNTIAIAYMHRARLTHEWSDWDNAKSFIDDAFKVASEGSGPFMTRASLNFSLHHFPDVDVDLDRVAKKIILQHPERAAILTQRAELATQRGQLEDAKRLMEEAYTLHKDPTILVQQGIFAFKMGDLPGARVLLDRAIAAIDKKDTMTLAWATLQRGIIELDSGQIKEANAFFLTADEAFSGWYLIEEHLAETYALLGEHTRARAMYESIVARVPTGEFMEALADTCEALKDDACATAQRQRAEKTYLADIASHPQAAYGHGMDFFLQGEDTAKMLDIAKANHALRPGHDAGTRLAQAYIRNGQLDEAKPLLEAALASGWSTADLHATASTYYAMSGDAERAEEQKVLAVARHPEAMADIAWLVPIKTP